MSAVISAYPLYHVDIIDTLCDHIVLIIKTTEVRYAYKSELIFCLFLFCGRNDGRAWTILENFPGQGKRE